MEGRQEKRGRVRKGGRGEEKETTRVGGRVRGGEERGIIEEECLELMEKLDYLRVGDEVVPYETLSKLIELYNSQNQNKHLSIERLISGLAVRRKVCKQVFEDHLDESVFRALDEVAI